MLSSDGTLDHLGDKQASGYLWGTIWIRLTDVEKSTSAVGRTPSMGQDWELLEIEELSATFHCSLLPDWMHHDHLLQAFAAFPSLS